MASDSVSAVERQVVVLLRLLTATRPQNADAALLDRSAYLILHELLQSGTALALQDLAERLRVDLSTISRQVASMEGKGILQRQAVPTDSRVHVVAPTSDGVGRFEAMRDARRAIYTDILDDWSEEERVSLARQLNRLTESIRRYKRRAKGSPR